MTRTSKGRQRITMAKMQNESNLQVTFSKRRTGLFKKSSELTTLCGAEMLVIVFSPGKKVFSFGHPSVNEMVDRFLGTINGSSSSPNSMGFSLETQQLVEAHRVSNIRELNARLMEVQEMLEAEKRRGDAMTQAMRVGREQRWWEGSIEDMTYQQLEELKGSLENVKALVTQKMSMLSNQLPLLGAAANSIATASGEGSSNGSNTGPLGAESTGFTFNRNTQCVVGGRAPPVGVGPPNFGGLGQLGLHHTVGRRGYFYGGYY